MNAFVEECTQHVLLLEEYRALLREWAEIRGSHPDDPGALEVVEATRLVEEMELKLRKHRLEHGC